MLTKATSQSKKPGKAKTSYAAVSKKKKLQTAGVKKVVGGFRRPGSEEQHNETFVVG